jgi:hypothetical protein
MSLPMTPRVYKALIAQCLCSPLVFWVHMVCLYGLSWSKLDMTESAPICLSPEQHPSLFRVGFPCDLSLLALSPVLAQSRGIGRRLSSDFHEAGHRNGVGLDQFGLSFVKYPGGIAPEVAFLHPLPALMRVAAFRPVPEHLPLGLFNFGEDLFGCTVTGIVRPSSYNGVEVLHHSSCRGLFMPVQVGAESPDMFQDFLLLWPGQQRPLFPTSPDVQPQEVQSFCDVHSTGFGFTERQATLVEEVLHAGSGIGFQYFPCRGRDHTV